MKGRNPAKMIVTAVNAPMTTLLKRDSRRTVGIENWVMTASPCVGRGLGETLGRSEFPAGNSGFDRDVIRMSKFKFNE